MTSERRVRDRPRPSPVRTATTLALILVVSPALLALLDYLFEAQPQTVTRVGPPLVGLFPLIMMFLITSIAMLRERTTGTLERLMSMPLSKLDLLWAVVALAIANAVLGMALGRFLSAFATSEFQAVQFTPAFVFPQLLLIGLFIPRERLPNSLDTLSGFLPFTYAYEALAKVAADDIDSRLWIDISIVTGCIVLALLPGATTLRRRTP